jgi:hypothetical protein
MSLSLCVDAYQLADCQEHGHCLLQFKEVGLLTLRARISRLLKADAEWASPRHAQHRFKSTRRNIHMQETTAKGNWAIPY